MSSRRRFLKSSGAGLAAYLGSPYLGNALTNSLFQSALRQAQAQTLAPATRKLITFHLFGAPLRTMFDHFLKTQGDEGFAGNPMIATRYSRGGNEAGPPEYALDVFTRTDGTQVLVPPFWKTSAPTASGNKSFESLLQHMVLFRGYGTGVDGHPFNAAKQTWPLGSLESLGGLISDQSKMMFPSINYPNTSGLTFKSSGKTSSQTLHHQRDWDPTKANLLKALYTPFAKHDVAVSSTRVLSTYAARLSEIQSRLRTVFEAQPSTQRFAREHTKNAVKSIQTGVEGFADKYVQIFHHYNHWIHTAARELGAYGFTDQVIAKRVDSDLRFRVTDTPLGDPQLLRDVEFRNSLASWNYMELSQSFALADYLVGEGVSDSVELLFGVQPFMDVPIPGGTQHRRLDFDQHSTGSYATLLHSIPLYRGLAAGMMELIERLKQKTVNNQNLWNQTVIQICSEFGRSPRNDGSGSDHGFNAMVMSTWSGAVKKGPFILGNIQRETPNSGAYTGTWGQWAPTTVQGQNVLLSPLHVNSSLATMVGSSRNPWVNLAPSLLQQLNGEIVLANGVSQGRIVG